MTADTKGHEWQDKLLHSMPVKKQNPTVNEKLQKFKNGYVGFKRGK